MGAMFVKHGEDRLNFLRGEKKKAEYQVGLVELIGELNRLQNPQTNLKRNLRAEISRRGIDNYKISDCKLKELYWARVAQLNRDLDKAVDARAARYNFNIPKLLAVHFDLWLGSMPADIVLPNVAIGDRKGFAVDVTLWRRSTLRAPMNFQDKRSLIGHLFGTEYLSLKKEGDLGALLRANRQGEPPNSSHRRNWWRRVFIETLAANYDSNDRKIARLYEELFSFDLKLVNELVQLVISEKPIRVSTEIRERNLYA